MHPLANFYMGTRVLIVGKADGNETMTLLQKGRNAPNVRLLPSGSNWRNS